MNVKDRICSVTVSVNSHVVTLKITFPLAYPNNAAPSFQLDENSSIVDLMKTKILKVKLLLLQLNEIFCTLLINYKNNFSC